MNIGGGQIRGALFNFFVVKKCPFLHLPDAALSFYNNAWWTKYLELNTANKSQKSNIRDSFQRKNHEKFPALTKSSIY